MTKPAPARFALGSICLAGGAVVAAFLLGAFSRLHDRPVPARALHLLDPLTTEEIDQAARTLRRDRQLPSHVLFPALYLHEPPKEQVLAWRPGLPMPRAAFAVVYDRLANETHEAVVDLIADQVASYRLVPGVQPRTLFDEYEATTNFVRADPRVQAALEKRGLTDVQQVEVDLWGHDSQPEPGQPENARLGWAVCYDLRGGNGYARPIEGLEALVNLNTRQVVRVVDRGVMPLADNPDNFFEPRQVGLLREPTQPLEIVQPHGPSFMVQGHEVRWQNWTFRFANHPREGLVLYQVRYRDRDRDRSILYRASLSELVVPYGDPGAGWSWRVAFDEGEWGLGLMAVPMTRGKQVPGHALLFDSVFAGDLGKSYVVPASAALYERDGGVLWQHYTGLPKERLECRRSRELVLANVIVAGNYDYTLNWIFTQDGQIRAEVELSGVLLTRGVEARTCPRCGGQAEGEDRHGTLVAPNIVATNHQHFFCFRLDLDVDGTANTVSELNVRPIPRKDGKGFVVEETVLGTEREAQRDLDPTSQRCWKVFNPATKTDLGHFPGYVLEPGQNTPAYAAADSPPRHRAGFTNHHIWATRCKPDEQFSAGEYPNQASGSEGLPRFVADNEKLVGEDVVLWYTCGVTHVARPEEWPVMPTTRTGFRLVPHGFFTRNPALDLPSR